MSGCPSLVLWSCCGVSGRPELSLGIALSPRLSWLSLVGTVYRLSELFLARRNYLCFLESRLSLSQFSSVAAVSAVYRLSEPVFKEKEKFAEKKAIKKRQRSRIESATNSASPRPELCDRIRPTNMLAQKNCFHRRVL